MPLNPAGTRPATPATLARPATAAPTGESGAWRNAAERGGTPELLRNLRAEDADHFDSLSVTALLESTGLRDADARTRYDMPDMFALGDALFPPLPEPGTRERRGERPTPTVTSSSYFLRRYASGLGLLAPAAVQIAAFVLFGFSLWAWTGFTGVQALTVALTTLLSLLCTAPAVQAIARRGHYYRRGGNPRLFSLELRRLSLFGLACVLLTGVCAALGWGLFPAALAAPGEFYAYFSLLSCFWLAIARLDALGQRQFVAPVTVAGLALVVLLHAWGRTGVEQDQWAGLCLVDLTLLALAEYTSWRRRRQLPAALAAARLLPLRALVARIWPLLLYGVVYYLFLFADRIVAWTAGPLPHGRPIVFRGDYEAGLDCALLVLFMATSVLEYTVQRFSEQLIPAAAATRGSDHAGLGRAFRGTCLRQILLLLAVGAGSLAVGLVVLDRAAGWGGDAARLFGSETVRGVYVTGAIGYLLLALGLYFGTMLQGLARQGAIVVALLLGLLVNVVVGEAAARSLGYAWATLGLDAGAATFALVTAVQFRAVLRRAPYYLSRMLA